MDHSFLRFTLELIVNMLQLKFQANGSQAPAANGIGSSTSPFDSHPITMLLAILWILLYCWAALTSSTTTSSSSSSSWLSMCLSWLLAKASCSVQQFMLISWSMAMLTMGYLLFPNSAQPYVLYALYSIIAIAALLRWAWLQLRTPILRFLSFLLRAWRDLLLLRLRSRRRRNLIPL